VTALRRPAPRRVAQPALLLRRFPYGESSLVLHALTPDEGRVSWLAKGAYRPSSGFFAVFDLFDTLDVRWSTTPGRELGLVNRGSVARRRNRIAGDLARYRVALSVLELAHLTAREGHEERTLFGWLESTLDLLQGGRARPELVAVAADLGLLVANGLAPALERCASCGARPAERGDTVAFSAALGGRLCAACAGAARARGRAVDALPASAVRVTASLMSATPGMLERMHVDPALLERVRSLVARFLEHHLETRLASR
jgi:DNA repair protein RecO (recombination protein O)